MHRLISLLLSNNGIWYYRTKFTDGAISKHNLLKSFPKHVPSFKVNSNLRVEKL